MAEPNLLIVNKMRICMASTHHYFTFEFNINTMKQMQGEKREVLDSEIYTVDLGSLNFMFTHIFSQHPKNLHTLHSLNSVQKI